MIEQGTAIGENVVETYRSIETVAGFDDDKFFARVIIAQCPCTRAKEGADGLLGLAIEHPEYPDGLGVVIKIAHGWNAQATWYIARGILGVLGFTLRNPYPLRRQKAFLVEGVVPSSMLKRLESIPTWDDWDPNQDQWYEYNV